MKLLIDECLSEELAKLAQKRGHSEASHIAWIGKRGWKDWQLKSVILRDRSVALPAACEITASNPLPGITMVISHFSCSGV
jgi:hypothetical protein